MVPVLTVLLVTRECPWRCLMCDLWKFAVPDELAPGLVPRQVEAALGGLAPGGEPPEVLKLYNAGSFFDPRAIPPADHPELARQVARFGRVVVECHPALVGQGVVAFRDRMVAEAAAAGRPEPRLEVAMGLETIHPRVLPRLNKGMTPLSFRRAACFLRQHDIDVRAFLLVQPPFLGEAEALEWAQRSLAFAFECGVGVAVLIPTRQGNGAIEALAARGEFTPPRLEAIEAALAAGLRLRGGRVFVDLWNLGEFARCPACLAARRERLERMNLEQSVLPGVACDVCGPGSGAGSRAGGQGRDAGART